MFVHVTQSVLLLLRKLPNLLFKPSPTRRPVVLLRLISLLCDPLAVALSAGLEVVGT